MMPLFTGNCVPRAPHPDQPYMDRSPIWLAALVLQHSLVLFWARRTLCCASHITCVMVIAYELPRLDVPILKVEDFPVPVELEAWSPSSTKAYPVNYAALEGLTLQRQSRTTACTFVSPEEVQSGPAGIGPATRWSGPAVVVAPPPYVVPVLILRYTASTPDGVPNRLT
jgi:hypothetical protein